MKRWMLALIFLASLAYAGPRTGSFVDPIGPAKVSGTSPQVFIAAPTVKGARNCITNVNATVGAVSVQAAITLNLLSGGTTNYSVDASTGYPVQLSFSEGNPWCADPGQVLAITATNSVGSTINISYSGYSYLNNVASSY